MRWFWLTLLLLGIVGLGLALRRDPDPSVTMTESTPPAVVTDVPERRDAGTAGAPESASPPAPPPPDTDAPEIATSPSAAADAEPADASPALDDLLGTGPPDDDTAPSSAPDAASALEATLTEVLDAELTADGTTVDLDGAGTAEDPYRASWTMLEEMRRTYRPQDGVREVPPVVAALDGTVVELAGFHLMPWTRGDVTQILLLKYIWDGCCIGVPPSPFTAIDVEFAEPTPRAALPGHAITTIRGTLRLEPYEFDGWLLELYFLDDAVVVPPDAPDDE